MVEEVTVGKAEAKAKAAVKSEECNGQSEAGVASGSGSFHGPFVRSMKHVNYCICMALLVDHIYIAHYSRHFILLTFGLFSIFPSLIAAALGESGIQRSSLARPSFHHWGLSALSALSVPSWEDSY